MLQDHSSLLIYHQIYSQSSPKCRTMLKHKLSCPLHPSFALSWRKTLHFQKGHYTVGLRTALLKPKKAKTAASWFTGSLWMKPSINSLLHWSCWTHPGHHRAWKVVRNLSARPMQAAWLNVLEMCLHLLARGQNPRSPSKSKPTASSILSSKQKQRWVSKRRGRREASSELRAVRGNASCGRIKGSIPPRTAHSKQMLSAQSMWVKLGPFQLACPSKPSGTNATVIRPPGACPDLYRGN